MPRCASVSDCHFRAFHTGCEDLEIFIRAGPVLGDRDVLLVDRDPDGLLPALDETLFERQYISGRGTTGVSAQSPAGRDRGARLP